ncbi:MAG TPA: hypothetical protein PKM32_05445, partial [Planctomycetota bacterium]|nr:hypothetical protein [Planctomycetota bacterium]
CSPDGKYLAFFQTSETGKGKVHLNLWDLKNKKLQTIQENIFTTESCKIAWSPKGRFLATIHTGVQEQIVLYDREQGTKFQMIEKIGKIDWIDWTNPSNISFTYKEGLFTRPYLLNFISLFSKN